MHMRIAFVGLETSHPFSDARNLRALDPAVELVACGRPGRMASFAADNPSTRVFPTVSEVLASSPDVAIISVRPEEVAAALRALCAAGVPVFINKPAAVTIAQVDEIEAILRDATSAFLTGSVLSFAPAVAQASIERSQLVAVEATLRHDVSWWRDPAFAWQAAESGARGLVPVIGVHAFDVLASTVGEDFEVEAVQCGRRAYPELNGGDSAQLLLRFSDGLGATVSLIGASDSERYAFEYHTATSTSTVSFPDDSADPFGYVAAASQILALGRGEPAPRSWQHSLVVLRQLSRAADLSRKNVFVAEQ